MRLLELRIPAGKKLLAFGVYCGELFVWAGDRQVWPRRRRPAPRLVLAAPVREFRLDRGSRAGW